MLGLGAARGGCSCWWWLWLLAVGAMPVWAYLLAAYLGWSLLKIRTFLEHRAHEAARARTVIIEDRGPLALLFLNNNFHVVHHMHPGVPWYRLPAPTAPTASTTCGGTRAIFTGPMPRSSALSPARERPGAASALAPGHDRGAGPARPRPQPCAAK